jgi:hypothetical protein
MKKLLLNQLAIVVHPSSAIPSHERLVHVIEVRDSTYVVSNFFYGQLKEYEHKYVRSIEDVVDKYIEVEL